MPEYKTIVTATDFSDAALAGIRHAADLAKRFKSRLILVYVVDARLPPLILDGSSEPAEVILENHRRNAERKLEAYAREHLEGLAAETMVLQGFPHEAIVEVARAREADVIVVGTHGLGFMGRMLMGSTAERILHSAPCPVLVVPSGR